MRGWIPGGRVASADLFPALAIPDSDTFPKSAAEEGGQATALVRFAELNIADFRHRPDPWDDFGEQLSRCLAEIAEWLRKRPKAAFVGFRERGIRVDLLVQTWIDCNQLDVAIPPALSRVCGDFEIGLVIMTNE